MCEPAQRALATNVPGTLKVDFAHMPITHFDSHTGGFFGVVPWPGRVPHGVPCRTHPLLSSHALRRSARAASTGPAGVPRRAALVERGWLEVREHEGAAEPLMGAELRDLLSDPASWVFSYDESAIYARAATMHAAVSAIRASTGGVWYPGRSDMMATTSGAVRGGQTMAMSLARP